MQITSIPEPMYDFPDGLLKNINFFKSASSEALEIKIEELKNSLSNIKDQIDSDKAWKEEFKNGLSQNNAQIVKIGEALEDLAKKLGAEIEERKTGESVLKSKFSVIKGIGIVLGAIFGGGLVSLIVWYLAGILNFG